MISAWARMCKIFGTEFTQYLPLVMPSVMKAASIKPEVAVIDGLFYHFLATLNKLQEKRVNPLSPNIHMQILQTDLDIFPLTIS